MDFTWETQSPNQMGVTTRLKHSNGRYGDEMSSPCEVEFNHNKLFHRLDAPDGLPSYRREIQDETRLFQSDCQNRIPPHFANRPIHCESSIQFPDTATYPGVSSTHNEIPLICTGNTPGVTSLHPWKAQTRMPPYGEGIQSDSNKLSRRHQASSTNGIPFSRTDNPRELYINNFPLNPRDLQQSMSQYAVGIQSSFDRTQQFQQPCSTNKIPSHQTGNTSEMRPDNIPRINSSNPRKHNSRMTCGIDILSDSKKVIQLYQGRSTDGFPFYQTDNPRELYPGNIPRETPLDPREVQRRTPPNLFQLGSSPTGIPSYRVDNPREIFQMPAESETLSYQTGHLQKVIPFCEADVPEGVITIQDDERTYEGMKAPNPKTNANRSESLAPCQPVTPEQRNHNLSGIETCPRCHCVLKTQPQPSYLPSRAQSRPSVIMVPLERKLKNGNQETLLSTSQDQERTATRESPQENEDSDLSGEGGDNDAEQESCFRVDIDGTMARFKLTKEDWARIAVKSFPSGGRLLSGNWSRIFADKIKESNPWCNVRFKNNHVRSANSRKVHSSVFFRGGAECKRPECNVKMKLMIREEYGKQVEVTYVGNVCHSDLAGEIESRDVTQVKSRRKYARCV